MHKSVSLTFRYFAAWAILLAPHGVRRAAPQAGGTAQSKRTNPKSVSVEQFQKTVNAYVNLHKSVAGTMAPLKTTDSPGRIVEYQSNLAALIRARRKKAKRGDIFTSQVSREFRRLIGQSLKSAEGPRILASLRRGAPANIQVVVNGVYPAAVPLETTPASLLLNLPPLPPEVDYRIVGNSLILRDVTANLIVDYIPKVIP